MSPKSGIRYLLPGFYKVFNVLLIGSVQKFSFYKFCLWCRWLQFLNRVAESASARSCKKNDLLACKIIFFKEGIDNGWCNVPPDWVLKCSQFPSCVDFTGFNCIQNCVYCYYLSFFSKIALKHRPHYFHI